MINLSSQHLRSILALLQNKEDLLAQLSEVNAALVEAASSVKPAATEPALPAKKAVKSIPVKAAKPKSAAPAKNDDRLLAQIVDVLTAVGEDGLTIPEMAEKLNVPEADLDALLHPFSKKTAKKNKKSSKPVSKPGKRGPKPGKKPGGTKARILALLEAAGSKGLTVKEVAEKLNLSRAGVSVWFGKTGKNLTTRLAPGVYALKS